MLISFSTPVIALQLIVAVADNGPQFNIGGARSAAPHQAESGGVPPSHVELLTCLQGQQPVKKLNK